MTNESLIEEVGRRLAVAAPDAQVILFGSYARGEAGSGSDLDLLVIEPEVKHRTAEFVRLRRAVGEIGVPVDLLLYGANHVERWGEVPGTLIHEALREGRVLAGA
jgi:predicted nucleotidyltransferase